MQLPDRVAGLIQKIEAGQTVTRDDLGRVATLQALDYAKLDEDFAREMIAADAEQTKLLESA